MVPLAMLMPLFALLITEQLLMVPLPDMEFLQLVTVQSLMVPEPTERPIPSGTNDAWHPLIRWLEPLKLMPAE